jgi:hypothetical protein
VAVRGVGALMWAKTTSDTPLALTALNTGGV